MRINWIPNVISLARIAAAAVLFWLATSDARSWFVGLLLAAGLSDVLDGWLARRFGWTSALGSRLDSAADIALVLAVIFGIWVFHPQVLLDHWPSVSAVLGIWSLVHAIALVRHGHLLSLHSYFIRLGMLLFGIFVVVLFFHGFVAWLFYPAMAVCFLGGVQNLLILFRSLAYRSG